MLLAIRIRYILITVTILFSFASFGQSLIRKNNESAEMFAERLKPDSTEIAYTKVETNVLDTTKKIIVSFYKKTIHEAIQMDTYVDHSQYDILIGFVYIPTDSNSYTKILIDTIHPDGGDPEIISIFFENADNDKYKELIVLCKYMQRHYYYSGNSYATFIFDYLNDENRFKYLDKLSQIFFGCDCGFSNKRKALKAKYKTEEDIILGLRKMGFAKKNLP